MQTVHSMANQPHAFKHRDVVRVVKAARAAGVNVDQVTVDPHTGAITASAAVLTGGDPPAGNPWDEVLTNASNKKRPA
jgi:hypothetical protein